VASLALMTTDHRWKSLEFVRSALSNVIYPLQYAIDLPIQLFDTLTKLYSSVKHTLLNGGYEQYELEPIVSEVDKIVIVFNGQSKLLRSMRMNATGYDGEKSSIQVNYTYEKLKMSDIPPLTKYLVLDQGDARLNASYSSYRLINFLNR